MDFGKAFTYVFEDPNWLKKVGIGGALLIVPIFGICAVYGYMLTVLKNIADGQTSPLPEWADFGGLFMKGLYAFVGVLIYFLPAILIYCCVGVVQVAAGSAVGAVGGRDTGATVASLIGFLSICLNCVLGLYMIVAGLTLYAPLTRFAMSANQLSLFWDFKGNLDFVQKNLGNYLMAIVVAIAAGIVAEFGLILCIIGVLFTTFWAQMVVAHALGQLWKGRAASAAG